MSTIADSSGSGSLLELLPLVPGLLVAAGMAMLAARLGLNFDGTQPFTERRGLVATGATLMAVGGLGSVALIVVALFIMGVFG